MPEIALSALGFRVQWGSIGIMENGNYYLGCRIWGTAGFHRDNGKEHGNYYLGLRV